jgi:hypothetical protein
VVGLEGFLGIGSVFCLPFALRQGLNPVAAQTRVSLTLGTAAASVGDHGVTAQPMMRRYHDPHRSAPAPDRAPD